MMRDEQIYTLALTRIPGLGLMGACALVRALGSASAVFQHRKELKQLLPEVSDKLIKALDCPDAFQRAEQELEFAEKNQIQCITLNDVAYPSRLRECEDAPLALFYRGNVTLDALHVVSVVGTRHATPYGADLCHSFVRDLKELCPDVLIVSGLAYGIDINAHRAALQYGFPTVGVLAHGLDRIYPSVHRNTAAQMIECGGLLTEYASHTEPERTNFLQRNRIVAGMSDATIIVESASKGGSLVTASIANSYGRDCFTFPGRVNDASSVGCHRLIRNNQAALITSAEDFVEAMLWDTSKSKLQPVQGSLFPELNSEESRIVALLDGHLDGMPINTLAIETGLPIHRISATLFELELRGIVRPLAGSAYRLNQL
jgi:DNA processing protein